MMVSLMVACTSQETETEVVDTTVVDTTVVAMDSTVVDSVETVETIK